MKTINFKEATHQVSSPIEFENLENTSVEVLTCSVNKKQRMNVYHQVWELTEEEIDAIKEGKVRTIHTYFYGAFPLASLSIHTINPGVYLNSLLTKNEKG